MKHIKILSLLVCLLASSTLVVAQNNGRDGNTAPQQAAPAAETNVRVDEMVNGTDFDEPRLNLREDEEVNRDFVFPRDFAVLEDELLNSANISQVLDQFNALKTMVMELRTANEELRLENRNIRKSLGSCCTATELGLSASDAYLMQNAPNPVHANTQVEFFVPEGLTNATIEIRDIKGLLIESYAVGTDGFGKLDIDRANLQTGTYLYYLTIDGEVVDSKVMIIK